jgi:glycine dehydrogenase
MDDSRRSLNDLEQRGDFIRRHIGPSALEQADMLAALGLQSLEQLADKVVPAGIRLTVPLALSSPRTEAEVLQDLKAIAAQNTVMKSLIGMGYYNCHTPTVIQRNILENPAWYTAYTPYQPEISQGRLEALLNFQTIVSDLTGMEIANASLLDEATAAAEAMAMCLRLTEIDSRVFFVSQDCHPQTIAVVRTRARAADVKVIVGDHRHGFGHERVFGVLLQYPASNGEIYDYRDAVAAAHAVGALVIIAADLLSLTLLKPPGEFDADVVVGTTQRFGMPLGYGGPHAAYLATKQEFVRAMPGRLVGVSLDSHGNSAYRLAIQTREQHIRREKATSNICTSQVLPAVVAGMYAVYHGPAGLMTIAERIHRLTVVLAEGLRRLDCEVKTQNFFDTIFVATGARTEMIHAAAVKRKINLCHVNSSTIGISLDETTTRADVETLWKIFAADELLKFTLTEIEPNVTSQIPLSLRRTTAYLSHPVFHQHHSETQMLRYMRSLSDKDLALDRAMIPLGSCTMKLNATTEMMPITWEAFSTIHPFAPRDQTQGYQHLISELEAMLCAITGFDAVSLQPNSGAQGEYAGLLAIRAFLASRGEGHRNICLIPSSAHGTNPASAHMANLDVVVIACDAAGNVDVSDLKAKAELHSKNLAALMITYPSTHGVFETAIEEICAVIHHHCGQVYIDGANMNALVGLAMPGKFGGDVCHLNLHKTFCIPHGGGGPGVGPIGVRAHLTPYLPAFDVIGDQPTAVGPVSAAPWGSAGVLPISYTYIALMGAEGLLQATCVAILNANYIAYRLAPHFPILYSDGNGMVAHECIIDLRPLKDATGITVEDVAKRLIDFGFHAPTMSFPVPGTLMIEPTESESKGELDRFCDAMIHIREEIRAIETGAMSADDNPLKNAPHTTAALVAEAWLHPYTHTQATFPVKALITNKYWPPVGRVDGVYGDRHLVCACPAPSDYSPALLAPNS